MLDNNNMNTSDDERVLCDKRHILIADDDPEIRRIFKMVLSIELPDYTIDTVENGAEAFTAFVANHHAVLLLDLHMPLMDGEDSFYEIRDMCENENFEMPSIIFITAYDPTRVVRNIVSKDPTHCMLKKPISNDLLVSTVRSRLAETKR